MSISRKKIVMILIMLFLLLASIFGTAYIDRVGEYKRSSPARLSWTLLV